MGRPGGRGLSGVALGWAMLLTGCCTTEAPVMDVPVIDVHAHVFNVRDLPVRGIIEALIHSRGEEDFAPERFPETLERILWRWTPSEPGDMHVQSEPDPTLKAGERDELVRFLAGTAGAASGPAVAETRALELEELEDDELLAETLHELGFLSDEDQSPLTSLWCRLVGVLRLLHVGTSSHQANVDKMKRTFGEQPDLYVHHLMDLGLTYDDEPSLPFRKQLEVFEELGEDNPELLHFVAFDPYRDSGALAMVKEGRSRGAIGVKFYPPSGYRPSLNDILEVPSNPVLARHWKSRYAHLGETPAEINERLDGSAEQLFAWCQSNDLPIFLHCTDKGFQADKGYGLHHGDPEYWAGVLEDYPELTIGFGHAGGYEDWSDAAKWSQRPAEPGVGACKSFEQKIYELCISHPNVYADFGYHGFRGDIVDGELEKAFATLFSRDGEASHRFSDKVMYGTDWYMVAVQPDPVRSLQEFDAMFGRDPLADHRGAFFAGNAARYLKLAARLEQGEFTGRREVIIRDLLAELR